jgi:nucleotide-binding universal stress UspA family protein
MSQPILVAYSPDSSDSSAKDFAGEIARVAGAPLAEFHFPEPDGPADAIESAIAEQQPALAVLAAPERTAERVIHGAACPVAVVPEGRGQAAVETVGAAFAPTPEGHEALRAAAALAGAFGARLRVVEALDPKHAGHNEGMLAGRHHDHTAADDAAVRQTMESEDTLKRAIAELPAGIEVETDELFQEPAHALVAASGSLDLLVMGSRGRGPIKSIVLGSVSRHVVGAATCPVLVLPRGTEGAVEALVSTAGAEPG